MFFIFVMTHHEAESYQLDVFLDRLLDLVGASELDIVSI